MICAGNVRRLCRAAHDYKANKIINNIGESKRESHLCENLQYIVTEVMKRGEILQINNVRA